jgi:hypothetical protein
MPNVGGKKFPYTKQGMKDAEEAKDKMGYKKGGDVKKKKKRVTSKDKIANPADASNKKQVKMDLNKRMANKKKREAKGDKFASDELKFNRTVPRQLAQERAAGKTRPDGGSRFKSKGPEAAMNNTSAPKPPTPAQAATPMPSPGAAAGGMGMPPKKPPMPMMKKGGKVKKAKSGGKVRGAGIAKKGVRKCKMR